VTASVVPLTATESPLVWGHPALSVALAIGPGSPVRVTAIGTGDDREPARPASRQPAVEITLAGTGRDDTGPRTVGTTVGNRLRYTGHRIGRDGEWSTLEIDQRDPGTGLTATLRLSTQDGLPVLRASTRVVNDGASVVILESVSSLCLGGLLTRAQIDSGRTLLGSSEWLAEGRWAWTALRPAAFPDISFGAHRHDPRGRLSRGSRGGWSSGVSIPVAGVFAGNGPGWLWQIEHNGSWEWELAEQAAGLALALSGPRDDAHGWSAELVPGACFDSVPVAVAYGAAGLDAAIAGLTRYRRAIRAVHPDTAALPLVFNDYMNTLNGDPTSDRLTPLIEAAATAGAEVFCIDAGWYDDEGDWWDSVGEWQPSTRRFEHGLGAVVNHIQRLGMVAGLWLEPEVIGVRSPVAGRLPAAAFFRRHGERVREHGRIHLDLRHPAARAHLDGVVDRLVRDFGVGYFKLDYNIDPGVGTDTGGLSAGAGLLGHNRAYLDWLDGVLARHPALVLENCASGGMRADYALLSRLHLQSTSDQQDPLRYPPIAAAAPMAMLPEQAASWAYPQPGMSLEECALTLATGLTGRLYLSGHLNRLDDERRRIVGEAVATWREARGWLTTSEPIWPLGLPGWDDGWVAAGLRHGTGTRLVLTRRFGAGAAVGLSLPHLRGRAVRVEHVFPRSLPEWGWSWDTDAGLLEVTAAGPGPGARILELT
jgi:alpha-galactosidase